MPRLARVIVVLAICLSVGVANAQSIPSGAPALGAPPLTWPAPALPVTPQRNSLAQFEGPDDLSIPVTIQPAPTATTPVATTPAATTPPAAPVQLAPAVQTPLPVGTPPPAAASSILTSPPPAPAPLQNSLTSPDAAPTPSPLTIQPPATNTPAATPGLDSVFNAVGDGLAMPATDPKLVAQNPQPAVAKGNLSRLATLKNISARTFRDRIGRLYQGRIQGQLVPGTQVEAIAMPAVGGKAVKLQVDYTRNTVVLEGDPATVGSWERMIQLLDRASTERGEQSDIVPLARTKQTSVQRVADIVQNLAGQPKPMPRPPANIVQWNRDKTRVLAQAPQAQPGVPGAAPAPAESPGLTGPVVIQYVEGLDALLIRGNAPDVERVRKIIDEIEEISQTTEPSIVVVDLENVDSESMADLVRPLQDEILASRQGQVSITPLIKPNSILMIGRLQGVKVLQDLIKKLDRPVDPAKEFHVFRLENLSATEAEEAINRFYEDEGGEDGDRPGLGAKVNIVADYRTNSLIVQANPRDAEELRQLLKQIDTKQAAAKDEVRVFNLKNTLANEIAPLLQQVLSGQQGTGAGAQGGVGGGIGGQGAQGGAQGAGTGTTGQARSATLSLKTIDRRGKRLYESGILTGVSVVANAQGNTLVVRGPKDSMPLIAELVRQLDELPSEDAEVKVFTIVHGDATLLATLLQTLFGSSTGGAQQQGGVGGVGGGAGGAGATTGTINPLIPLRISVDARTNSIVVAGSVPDLLVVQAILLRLDEQSARQRSRKTETFRLRYAFATDVADAINNLLTGRQTVQTLAPNTVPQLSLVESQVIVVPEPVSNSLVVSATPEYFEEIYRIIREIDAEPPMVAIQMLIAEVDLSRFYELGVEIGIQDSLLFDRGTGLNFNNTNALPDVTDAVGLATAGTLGAQGLGNFGLGRNNAELGFGGLVLSASNDAVSILIRALQQDQRLQVLSRPQVQTLDNQPAFVQVGQRVPFVTGTNLNGFGGTSSQVSLLDVGIILGVTPRVTPDGNVIMELDATKSELGPLSEGIPISVGAGGEVIRQPILESTTAQTTISARSGQTVVIGGLITESDSEVHRGVPYLSGIPLIGDLFRYDQDTKQRTELIIVMTPYVIRDDQDLECFNRMETGRMSWCLNDAYRVHGRGNECVSKWPTAFGGETQPLTIYPDQNPSAGPKIATPFSPLSSPINPSAGFAPSGGTGFNGTGFGGASPDGLKSIPPGAQILSDRPAGSGVSGVGTATPGLPSVPSGGGTPNLFTPGQ